RLDDLAIRINAPDEELHGYVLGRKSVQIDACAHRDLLADLYGFRKTVLYGLDPDCRPCFEHALQPCGELPGTRRTVGEPTRLAGRGRQVVALDILAHHPMRVVSMAELA